MNYGDRTLLDALTAIGEERIKAVSHLVHAARLPVHRRPTDTAHGAMGRTGGMYLSFLLRKGWVVRPTKFMFRLTASGRQKLKELKEAQHP